MQLSQQHPQNLSSQSQLETSPPNNRLIEENNKRAYQLLMRIQSQLEASTVMATSSKKVSVYE